MLFVVIKIVTTRRIRQTPSKAIHTFAGIQLRLACADYMQKAGRPEPTGHAVVTDAYNLPSRHVIHTVGPIANGRPTLQHRDQLASCYRACLDAAAAAGDTSIAFCCISTGVFGFPPGRSMCDCGAYRARLARFGSWRSTHRRAVRHLHRIHRPR